MKKLTFLFIAAISIAFTSCSIFQGGDDSFQGVITYSIDYEGDIDEATLAQSPTQVVEYYKGTKVRKDQETAMYSIGVITDNSQDSTSEGSIVLMDIPMMGEKIAMRQSKEDMDKAKAEMGDEQKPEYNETTETKEILGYTCKKVDVTIGEDTFPVYYTTEIKVAANPNTSGQYSEIDGVILEYTTAQQGMIMHFIATEVKKQKLSNEIFSIPEDYTEKTAEEMQSLFGM
jgi:GLPGLI family protein